jgi:NADH:ubiquinone oxidoreductase subunit E
MEAKVRSVLEGFQEEEGALIPTLQAIQSEFGYISLEAVEAVSAVLSIPESKVYGVATFYSEFRLARPGEHNIKVCMGTSCYLKGGKTLLDRLTRKLGIRPGMTTPDGKYRLETVACLGCCSRSPVVVVDDAVYGDISPSEADDLISRSEV